MLLGCGNGRDHICSISCPSLAKRSASSLQLTSRYDLRWFARKTPIRVVFPLPTLPHSIMPLLSETPSPCASKRESEGKYMHRILNTFSLSLSSLNMTPFLTARQMTNFSISSAVQGRRMVASHSLRRLMSSSYFCASCFLRSASASTASFSSSVSSQLSVVFLSGYNSSPRLLVLLVRCSFSFIVHLL